MSAITPSQTVGPFLHIALGPVAMRDGGVRIHGRVLDGAGEPVPDALVEVSAPDGCFGRSDTRSGGFELAVVKPVPRDDQAPHLAVSVFARGLLKRAVTRMYFPDEAEANAADPVLSGVEEGRRSTLIAVPEPDGSLHFDVHLQGPDETVFFAL
jgi:protocatechuate 3,4-dioxygenase, alpha subunit